MGHGAVSQQARESANQRDGLAADCAGRETRTTAGREAGATTTGRRYSSAQFPKKFLIDQHCGQQRCAGREVLDEHRFVPRVRAFADRAHAVERGNAERRGEVAV